MNYFDNGTKYKGCASIFKKNVLFAIKLKVFFQGANQNIDIDKIGLVKMLDKCNPI